MKFIKQISTGKSVYREAPHSDKTLGNASNDTGIALNDLQVVDESLTDEQWNQKCEDAKPWIEKIADTDAGMPRHMEDLITDNPSLTIHENMKTRYDEKVALRATKP
tara:strand:+ start:562 stop:882 length:321 start_codon:yes stop_codon:yes gene_type:complete